MTCILRAAGIAAWLLSMTIASVQAQSSLGAGGVQCSQYIKAARSSDILYHQASNWLLGYVNGVNYAAQAAKGSAPPINLSNDQVLKSAGDYCEAHPNGTVADAAGEWYASLPKQAAEQPAPKQAASSGSLILNLDNAPARKPLLDRR